MQIVAMETEFSQSLAQIQATQNKTATKSTASLHVASTQFCDRIAAEQHHGALELLSEKLQRSRDARLTTGGKRVQIAPPDGTGIGTVRKRFHDVIAAADAAIANDLEPIPQGIGHIGNAINRSRGRFKLAAAMV
jgi:hypothetical protein